MRVLSAIINDINTDQRVLKQVGVLNALDCKTTIVCRKRSESGHLADYGFKCVRLRFLINHGPLFYLAYNVRLFLFLLTHRFDLYVANDLDTLLPCYIISRIRRKPLVYDAHEYFTGQYGLKERKFPFYTWKFIERRTVPGLKYMMTVSDSIADLYYSEYGIKPVVIRNVAVSSEDIIPVTRAELGISENDLLIVIQGAGIHPERGVMELIDAVKLTANIHLLIIGSGDAMDGIIGKVSDKSVEGKVTLLPRMPWPEMMKYTKACDAGLSLDKNLSINQYFSLPNKLFDYISAGIPVIASSLPEVERIVKDYKCGLIIENIDPEAIACTLAGFRDDPVLRKKLKDAAIEASVNLVWENEMVKESDLFKKALNE